MKQEIKSDEEIVIPEKIIVEKRKRIQVIEETVQCSICKQEIVFTITNQFLDGILKKTNKKQKTYSHNPLECLKSGVLDFEIESEVACCGNCKQWAGTYDSCGDRRDEYCGKHSRTMTEEEFEWIKKFYPEKLERWDGKELTFEDMQLWNKKLKYICSENEWCSHYEDDR